MAKKTINISGSATQMVDDINSNFNELYNGAGGGSSSIDGLPTKRVKVYDAMTRAYNGGGLGSVYIPCNIKSGVTYYVEKSERNSSLDRLKVSFCDSNKTVQQVLIEYNAQWSAVSGAFDAPVVANQDGSYISVFGTAQGYVNVYHYEDVPTLGASRWLGKKWLVLGDSITTEHSAYAQVGYATLCATALGIQCENMAVSGETSAQQSARVADYDTDYDLVTAMVGTNDQGYNTTLGTISDSPAQSGSFYARMKYFYETLRTKYPKSVIAFITPIKRYNVAQGTYYALAPFAQAVRDVCEYYSTPCIDIYNAIDPGTQAARSNFFCYEEGVDDGGCHPNDVGHALFIAPIVEARLRDMAPFYFNDWEE